MLVFVTGVAGSGKSTLCAELSARRIAALDADEGISRHVRKADGRVVEAPPRHEQDADWVSLHEFRFDIERVKELTRWPKPTFLFGAAYGDDEVISLAETSWFLHLPQEELRQRIARRPPGSYGHAAHELDSILAWHSSAAQRYEALGARPLDATRPVTAIADELLAGHSFASG